MKEKFDDSIGAHKSRKRGWMEVVSMVFFVLSGFTDIETKWLNKLVGKFSIKRKRDLRSVDSTLKRSKGLKTRFIDFNKFNMEPFKKEKMVVRAIIIFIKIAKGVKKARENYKKELATPPEKEALASQEFWDEVVKKAESLGIGLIGFAPVDENLIFEKDYIGKIEALYENGIVLGMEMDFDAIDVSPAAQAGLEATRVYAELGVATNRLADFIRSEGYKAIACHPLGGPILYPAMAVKANLGEIGKPGLLITKKYGPRQRLSMIATNASPLPEGLHEELKISEFCGKCDKCIKSCPVNAVLDDPIIKENGIVSRIDTDKCIEYFYETDGCSICIKACPFHMVGYDKLL